MAPESASVSPKGTISAVREATAEKRVVSTFESTEGRPRAIASMQNMRAAQIEGVFARGTRHARNWTPHAYLHIIQRYTGRRSGTALRYWILASRTR